MPVGRRKVRVFRPCRWEGSNLGTTSKSFSYQEVSEAKDEERVAGVSFVLLLVQVLFNNLTTAVDV